MIRDFLGELLEYLNGSCKIPGIDEKISYGDEWESKAKSALNRAKRACEYESNNDYTNATKEWKKTRIKVGGRVIRKIKNTWKPGITVFCFRIIISKLSWQLLPEPE
jgi:hypothetical protein